MGLYEEYKVIDIVAPVVGKAEFSLTPEGEAKIIMKWKGEPQSPWISYVRGEDRCCPLWNNTYFEYYGIVPKGCRSCWKVVMIISSVRQLMKIEKYQQSCKYDCKCGIEARPDTSKLGKFGAYWYAPIKDGLEGGRKMFKWLQKEFPGVKLILKRGCTEMEQRWYPSDKWDEFADQRKWDFYEELLNSVFVLEDVPFGITPALFHPFIKARWIEWAFEHGDITYLDFVSKPFKEEYLTYQSSIHNNKDFPGSKFEPIKMKGIGDYGTDNHRPGKGSVGEKAQSFEGRGEEERPPLIQRVS